MTILQSDLRKHCSVVRSLCKCRGRKRAAASEAVRGDRDALEHDAALAAFGTESGRIPGEDDEFAAELRNALTEEERHMSSNHFRRSLTENKWCARRLCTPQPRKGTRFVGSVA